MVIIIVLNHKDKYLSMNCTSMMKKKTQRWKMYFILHIAKLGFSLFFFSGDPKCGTKIRYGILLSWSGLKHFWGTAPNYGTLFCPGSKYEHKYCTVLNCQHCLS